MLIAVLYIHENSKKFIFITIPEIFIIIEILIIVLKYNSSPNCVTNDMMSFILSCRREADYELSSLILHQ